MLAKLLIPNPTFITAATKSTKSLATALNLLVEVIPIAFLNSDCN
jgi:hypothetical protein